MMEDGMMMGEGMIWGMGLWGLVLAVLVVLIIAALVKYVFFR
ncbi:hypothetical protein [Roseicitreum antarcticum]|jgi:hypothetical protein|uniref:Uncharacterized protein n=1 Tax=Roseicitreum antarcticum TaxID=564137 RepID=A0A1H3DW51_9RHOB|nr:hypothetical protein [Roseicitreum antarcticum]SDX70646.1 hypothetical protein SAMN04488238_11629 [Roseicitreum antarcticum]